MTDSITLQVTTPQTWLDRAFAAVFALQKNKLKRLTPDERHALGEAFIVYERARQQGIDHPAADPAAALLGHCNKTDEQDPCQAAVRLMLRFNLSPADVPMLDLPGQAGITKVEPSDEEDDEPGQQPEQVTLF